MERYSSLIRLKAKLKQPARHCFVVLFAFATMGLMALLALNLSFLSPVAQVMRNFSLTDIYYHILKDTGSSEPSHVITIVDMTDIMDRDALASVIEDIEECRPKVLAVDMLFSGERDDSIGNAHLIRVAQQYPNIVYSYKLGDYVDDSVGYTSELHSFFTDEVSVKEGFTNFERTLYGAMKRSVSVRRRVNGEVRNSLALQVADIYADGKLEKVEADDYHINFCPRTYHVIPADSILQHRQWLENRIVLFGAMHEQIDTHTTPLGDIPGVELIAYSIQTMLEQAEVRHPSVLFTIVFSFVVVLVTYLLRLAYMRWAKKRKSQWLSFMLTSTFVVALVMFIWSAVLVGIGFFIFYTTNLSVNLGWALAAIPFLGGADEFFGLAIRHCFGGFNWF